MPIKVKTLMFDLYMYTHTIFTSLQYNHKHFTLNHYNSVCVHVYLSHPMGEPNTGKVVDIVTSIGRGIGSELNLLLVHTFVAQV